jgi:hypothetical protein
VLRNKGVPIEAAVITNGERTFNGDDLVVETRYVRFGNNEIADLEDAFGDMEGFSEATAKTPSRAVRGALACAWGVEPRVAGLMMLDGRLNDYATAVSTALAIANGVDPTQAAELLRVGVKAADKMSEARTAMIAETIAKADAAVEALAEAPSPGPSGSEPGPEPDVL